MNKPGDSNASVHISTRACVEVDGMRVMHSVYASLQFLSTIFIILFSTTIATIRQSYVGRLSLCIFPFLIQFTVDYVFCHANNSIFLSIILSFHNSLENARTKLIIIIRRSTVEKSFPFFCSSFSRNCFLKFIGCSDVAEQNMHTANYIVLVVLVHKCPGPLPYNQTLRSKPTMPYTHYILWLLSFYLWKSSEK